MICRNHDRVGGDAYAIADAHAGKRRWLLATTLMGSGAVALMFFATPAQPWLFVLLFLIANLNYELVQGFYNAFLPEIADDAYIKESILKPQARIVRGYEKSEVSMPTYEGVVTETLMLIIMGGIPSIAFAGVVSVAFRFLFGAPSVTPPPNAEVSKKQANAQPGSHDFID